VVTGELTLEKNLRLRGRDLLARPTGCGSNQEIYSMGAEELRGRGRVVDRVYETSIQLPL
jgi:hypothetical protein